MQKIKLILLNIILMLSGISVLLGVSKTTFVSAQTPYIVDYVPIESVEITTDCNDFNLHLGDSVNLGVTLTPYYAIETAQTITYKIVGGFSYAKIDNDTLTINDNAKIGAKVTVNAIVDEIESLNSLVFTIIEVPVESISILNEEEYIKQGTTLQVNTNLLPINASNKKINYSITFGQDCARITDSGLVIVNSNLPRSDAEIVVKITSDYSKNIYCTKRFKLYVPTTNLSVKADRNRICPGDTFNLVPVLDSNATKAFTPKYEIVSGQQYISKVEDETITLVNYIDIEDYSPSIVVKINYDDLEAIVTLDIYIPAKEIKLFSDETEIKQGETILVTAKICPQNATNGNLKYFIASGFESFASIDDNGNFTGKIKLDTKSIVVPIYVEKDGIYSEKYEISVRQPVIKINSSNYEPYSSYFKSEEITLTTFVDNVEQISNFNFIIVNGEDYIESITGNILKLKTNITDFNPSITLKAMVGYFESEAITINIKILAEEIVVKNNISEVYQKRSYNFKGTIFPENATFKNQQLTYSIDVDESIAEIDNNGNLTINENAPINQLINIIVTGPDNTEKTISVIVGIVYAENIVINGILKADGTTVSKENPVIQGDILYLDIEFIGEDNITDSQKKYSIGISDKNGEIATILGNTIIINNAISVLKPELTITLISQQNEKILSKSCVVTVYIPISKISIFAQDTMKQGEQINLNVQVTPLNATLTELDYYLDSEEYAFITNKNILKSKINPNIENVEVIVYAQIGDVTSEGFVVKINRPEFVIIADNYTPYSSSVNSQSVTLRTFKGNSEVSNVIYKLDNDKYGTIENNVLIVKTNIQDENPEINIIAEIYATESIEPYKAQITISIIILAESIQISNTEITEVEQKRTYSFASIVYPLNATDKTLTYSLDVESEKYCSIDNKGNLSISNKMPVGKEITIIVSGANSTTCIHKVLVKTVYVTEISISKTNINGIEFNSNIKIKPLDIISFEIAFSGPDNITESQKDYYIEILGNDIIATISDKTVIINESISICNPEITVFIKSKQGKDILSIEQIFSIYIPATGIIIYSEKQTIKQDESIMLNVRAIPENANIDGLRIFLDDKSKQYATLNGNILSGIIKADIKTSQVTIYAEIEGQILNNGYKVTIDQPVIELSANTYETYSSSTKAGVITLKVLKDKVEYNCNVQYEINVGGNYAIIENNLLKINTNIKDYNPTIKLNAIVLNAYQSNEITINIAIITESILINTNISEVEQSREYTISATVYPLNASDKSINYILLNEDGNEIDNSIATIDNGKLYISNKAQIGSKIIIKVYQNTINTTLIVTVRTVYATEISLNYIKRNNTIVDNDNIIRQGDIITFDVQFSGADNITESVKNYYLEILSGNSFADVSNNKQSITIHSNLNEENPIIKVNICSDQNGNIISCQINIKIKIFIKEVIISATKLEINENEEISVNQLLTKTIYPTCADTTDFEYIIKSGNDIAKIENGILKIEKSKLSKYNRTFTISANAKYMNDIFEDIYHIIYSSNITLIKTVQISVYINTKTLSIDVNETAESKINESSTLTVTYYNDVNSTGSAKIMIVSGAELINGNYTNGDYLNGLSFSVKQNLTNQPDLMFKVGNQIKIKAIQDGINSNEKIINVIVPVESMSLNLPKFIDRNFTKSITEIIPIYNKNINSYVTDKTFKITSIVNGEIENEIIKINLGNNSGSVVSVNYVSNGKNFTDYLIINSFSEEFDMSYDGHIVNATNKFTINYGKVYSTRGEININSSLQIEEGGYTTILLKYNDIELTNYKSLNVIITLTKGSEFTTITKLSNAEFKFLITKGTFGDAEICYDIIIEEENYIYKLNDLKLYVFKEFDTSLTPSITITSVETLLNIEKTQNASHFTNLMFEAVSNSTYTLDKEGNIKVLTNKLNSTSIKFQADQYYNGIKINNRKISMNCSIVFNNTKIFDGISAKITYNLNNVDTNGQKLTTKFNPSISSAYNSNSNTVLIKIGDSSVATVTDTKINRFDYYVFNGWAYDSKLITDSNGNFNKNIEGYISNKKWIYNGSKVITLTASWSKITKYSNYTYISTETEFLTISTSGNYVICDNIDLSKETFTPISSFSGIIDGNNNVIKNLSYILSKNSDGTCDRYGFIRTLNGTVKNLNFYNLKINVYKYRDGIENLYIGGICGELSGGMIENVTISENSEIIGNHYREVKDGNPVKTQVGGFAGAISSGTIKNCLISTSSVYGKAGCGDNNGDCHANVGGIVGEQNGGKIFNCTRNSTTSINSVVRGNTFWWGKGHLYGRAGGIVGYQGSNGIIENCVSSMKNYKAESDLESNWCKDRVYLNSGSICGKQDGTVN